MKRVAIGAVASALMLFGFAPAASAATSGQVGTFKVVKAKKVKPVKIDWDSAPTSSTGGVSAQRIDWD